MTLDLRMGREFRIAGDKRVVELAATASNVLNRANYTGFVGNLSSPLFRQATSARSGRRIELSLVFRF